MRASEIYQALLTCPVVYLQAGSALMNYRQVNIVFRVCCLFPNCACPKYVHDKKMTEFSFTLTFCILGWGMEDRMTLRSTLFFSPWAFSALLLLILGDFIPLSGLFWKKEVRQFRSVLTSIDFSTEGSQCLHIVLVQLFCLFGNCFGFSVTRCVQEY